MTEQNTDIQHEQTNSNIWDFYKFITNYPLLGLHHSVGKELENEIKSFNTTLITSQDWYRAKSPDGCRLLTKNDMLPPPPEETREGRYNHYGLPALYVSENEETGAAEISRISNEGILCWIQKINIHNAKVIDLTDLAHKTTSGNPFIIEGLLMTETITDHSMQNRKYYKPEYKITRFIADLCRLYNIDGIIYPSAVYYDKNNEPYKNMVIFDTTQNLFSFVGEPYVYDGSKK